MEEVEDSVVVEVEVEEVVEEVAEVVTVHHVPVDGVVDVVGLVVEEEEEGVEEEVEEEDINNGIKKVFEELI